MKRNLLIPNPDREIIGVKIHGWPIIISRGIILGAIPVPPRHSLNVTNKHEIHVAVRSYYELILNPYTWPVLEQSIIRISQAHGINQEDDILETVIVDDSNPPS